MNSINKVFYGLILFCFFSVPAWAKVDCQKVLKSYSNFLTLAAASKTSSEKDGWKSIFISMEQGKAKCFVTEEGFPLLQKRKKLFLTQNKKTDSVLEKTPTPKKNKEVSEEFPIVPVPKEKEEPNKKEIEPPLKKKVLPQEPIVPAVPNKEMDSRSSVNHSVRKKVKPLPYDTGFYWEVELSALSRFYQETVKVSQNTKQNFQWYGALLGGKLGYQWKKYRWTADLLYAVGNGTGFQLGTTFAVNLIKPLDLELGVGLRSSTSFRSNQTQGELAFPLEIGLRWFKRFKKITVGGRFLFDIALYNGASWPISFGFRLGMVLGAF